MKFIEDEIFWYPDTLEVTEEVKDPLICLPSDYRKELESSYSQYCLSILYQEHATEARHNDLDDLLLLEGKSLSSWRGAPKRHKHGKNIRTDDTYKRLVRRAATTQTNQFDHKTEEFENSLNTLMTRHLRNEISLPDLRKKSAEIFTQIYKDAWELGRKSSGIFLTQTNPLSPSREEEIWFRSAIREELKFWNTFLDEVEQNRGDFSAKRFTIEDRISMYAQSLKAMFNTGKLSGLPSTVLLVWYPKKKASGIMCPGCQYMVDNGPFTRDNMPTVPRAGDTPCLYHCVHRVIVVYSTPAAVEKRRKEMKTKERMVRDLHDTMTRRKHPSRPRAVHLNPWHKKHNTWGQIR